MIKIRCCSRRPVRGVLRVYKRSFTLFFNVVRLVQKGGCVDLGLIFNSIDKVGGCEMIRKNKIKPELFAAIYKFP